MAADSLAEEFSAGVSFDPQAARDRIITHAITRISIFFIFDLLDVSLCVINEVLLGVSFMNGGNYNPFLEMDALFKKEESTDLHIIDFHAETTSEKIALGYYLTGKVRAVLGTHTHVPTADERILEEKTAYISDVGMTGPLDGVIGCSKESILYKMTTGLNAKFEVATGKGQLNAVVLEFDDQTNQPLKIERIRIEV